MKYKTLKEYVDYVERLEEINRDLLQACKTLKRYYDEGEGNLIDEILPKLRNAINKAEGR